MPGTRGTDLTSTSAASRIGRFEFIVLVSMIMASTALGIDLILPAFADIRVAFGLAPDSTAVAGIVTAYFLGLAVAQVFYGPIADRFGRKPTLYGGYAIYLAGALAAAFAPSLGVVLVARFVWGVGAAGPRVVALSVVRDRFEGDQMARTMSFVMAIFVLVPVVAPSLGALILSISSWRWVFGFGAVYGAAVALWARRLPETLHEENRLELRFDRIVRAARYVVTNRQTLGYMLATTALFGAFSSYLASSELIVSDVFGQGDRFPLVFGGLASVMGGAMFTSGVVVARLGVRRLVHTVMFGFLACAATLVLLAWFTDGRPSFWSFFPGLALLLALYALLFPNFNTIAMDPMGRVAGTAAAVIGTVSTAVGALMGSALDRSFDGTIRPLSFGFLGAGALAIAFVVWSEKGRLFRPLRE